MVTIQSINSIHNETLTVKDKSNSKPITFIPQETNQTWNVNIGYTELADKFIEGNIIFKNTKDSSETIQFHFDSSSLLEHNKKEDILLLNIIRTEKQGINIALEIGYDKDNNAVVGDMTLTTGMDKITGNTNFIDYEHLKIQHPSSRGVNQLINECGDCSTIASFRTDYYDNYTPWIS